LLKTYVPHNRVIHATSEGIISLTVQKYFWLKLDIEQMNRHVNKFSISGLEDLLLSNELYYQTNIIEYLIEEGCVRYPHIFCEIDHKMHFTSNAMKLVGVFKSTRDFWWGGPFPQIHPENSLDNSPKFQIQQDSIFFVQYHSDHNTEKTYSDESIKKRKEAFKNCLIELCNSVKLCLEILKVHYGITVPQPTILLIYYARPKFFGEVLQEVQTSLTDKLSSEIIKSIRIYDFNILGLEKLINKLASENIDKFNAILKNREINYNL